MKYFYLLLPLTFITIILSGQSNTEVISSIRKVYYTVESIKTFDKTQVFEIDAESSELGNLQAFYIQDTIVKSTITNYGEMGRCTKDLYFKNNQLVFLFEVICNYDKPLYMENSQVISTIENRYYVWNNNLVKYISADKEESWNEQIPNYENKQEFIKDCIRLVDEKTKSKLLANLDLYVGRPIEDLLVANKDLAERITKITNPNDEVMIPLYATLASITKENDLIYSCQGEISWGEGVNMTFIVFDVHKGEIYIFNKSDEDSKVYSNDHNYPKVFQEWLHSMNED